MNQKKNILVLGITGSIAAYKIPQAARDLSRLGIEVFCVLTENGARFVTPWTLEALTGNPVFSDMFYLKGSSPYPHIELSKKAGVLCVAPASANFIAKAALGIADDLLSTVFLSCTCPKIVAPAMNSRMLLSPATQENLKTLKERGITVLDPEKGSLACGEEGAGRMADPAKIIKKIKDLLKKP